MKKLKGQKMSRKDAQKHDPDCCVLLSTQRSGTTLFSEYLAGHGYFGRAPERFLIRERKNPPLAYTPAGFFEIVKANDRSNSKYAVNIMANQLQGATRAFFGIGEGESQITLDQQAEFLEQFVGPFKRPVFVRLLRRDKLAQSISAIIHSKTGVAHVRAGKFSGREDASYDARSQIVASISAMEIAKWIRKLDHWEKQLDSVCARLSLPVHVVSYEEMSMNPDGTFSEFFEMIGLPVPVHLAPPKLQRTSDKDELAGIISRVCDEMGLRRSLDNDVVERNLRELPFTFSESQQVKAGELSTSELNKVTGERDKAIAEREELREMYKKSMRDPLPHLLYAYSQKINKGLRKFLSRL